MLSCHHSPKILPSHPKYFAMPRSKNFRTPPLKTFCHPKPYPFFCHPTHPKMFCHPTQKYFATTSCHKFCHPTPKIFCHGTTQKYLPLYHKQDLTPYPSKYFYHPNTNFFCHSTPKKFSVKPVPQLLLKWTGRTALNKFYNTRKSSTKPRKTIYNVHCHLRIRKTSPLTTGHRLTQFLVLIPSLLGFWWSYQF